MSCESPGSGVAIATQAATRLARSLADVPARGHARRSAVSASSAGRMRWRSPTALATSLRSCSTRARRLWAAGTRRSRTAWFSWRPPAAEPALAPVAAACLARVGPEPIVVLNGADHDGWQRTRGADAAAFANGRPAGARGSRAARRAWACGGAPGRPGVRRGAPGKGSRSARASRPSRRYGQTVALDGLTLTVPDGEVLGFVGPNGSGKTTAMRIAMGVLEQDAGEVRWNGSTATRDDQRHFGYMPEERGLYPKMRVDRQLRYLASAARPESERGRGGHGELDRAPRLERNDGAARGGAVAGKPAAGPARRGAGARPDRADPGRALLRPRSDRHRRHDRGAPASAPPMAWP